MVVYIFLGLFVILLFYVLSVYMRLVSMQKQIGPAFPQVQEQLERKYKHIGTFLQTAARFSQGSEEVLQAAQATYSKALEALQSAKDHAADAKSLKILAVAESELNSDIEKLLITMENNFHYKRDQEAMEVAKKLELIENQLFVATQKYNDKVNAYNSYKHTYPQAFFVHRIGHELDEVLCEI